MSETAILPDRHVKILDRLQNRPQGRRQDQLGNAVTPFDRILALS